MQNCLGHEFKRIKIAEQHNNEGNEMFELLSTRIQRHNPRKSPNAG